MKKGVIVALLSLLFGLLSGCFNPNEFADPDNVANHYLTTHPKFLEKYGEDYTLEYTGGGSLQEIGGRNGLSGTGSYECTINGTDQFSVALMKEKNHPWTAQGVVCTSAKYACNELNLIFEGSTMGGIVSSDELDSLQPNGVLYLNGEKIDVIVTLVSSRVLVYDASLYRQYKEELALTEPNRLDLPKEKEEACTLLICRIIGDFDMFTATPEPEYEDFSSVKEYHFYVIEDS